MTKDLFRLAAGIVLALLLAGAVSAADMNNTSATNLTIPVVWERTYGGLENETLLSMFRETDGGYLLLGRSAGNGTGNELYQIRTNANGTPLRENLTPLAGSLAMASPAANGGVVMVGVTGGGGILLLRLGPDGHQLWSRSYAVGSGRDTGDAVRGGTDGGFLVAGTTVASNGGRPSLLLLRVGEDGGEIWHRAVPIGGDVLVVHDLRATDDGGYMIVGSTDTDRAGSLDLLLVKVSSGGNREWLRTYSFGAEAATGYTLEPSADGGWLLLGGVDGRGSHAAVLVKVDTAGNEQWRKRLAAGTARTWGYALAPAGAGGYALAGAVEAPEGTRSYVAVLDRSGTEVWNRSFAIGNGPSRALAVTAGTDSLVVAGEASRTPDALYDLYLSSVAPPAVAPNTTSTSTVNVTATATSPPNGTPTANATSIPTTAVPATTRTAPASPFCLVAVAGVALLALLRRR